MAQRRRSIVMLLIAMVIWGSTFVVTKGIIVQAPPFTLAFARVAVGSLVLLPLVLIRQRRTAAGARLPWSAIVAMGFVGVALYYAAFNASLVYTSASQGALVQSCIPAITALVAVLWLGEQAGAARWFGIALSVAGVLIVFSGAPADGAGAALPGNLLMFLTVICWGVYTSLAKRTAGFDTVTITAAITAVGALMLLPLAAIEIALRGWPRLGVAGWLAVLYLGAIASGAAYMFYNGALKHLDASQAGVYTNLIPIVGVISGVVLLGEPLSMRAILGGVLVLTGVWITSVARAAARPRVSE